MIVIKLDVRGVTCIANLLIHYICIHSGWRFSVMLTSLVAPTKLFYVEPVIVLRFVTASGGYWIYDLGI